MTWPLMTPQMNLSCMLYAVMLIIILTSMCDALYIISLFLHLIWYFTYN